MQNDVGEKSITNIEYYPVTLALILKQAFPLGTWSQVAFYYLFGHKGMEDLEAVEHRTQLSNSPQASHSMTVFFRNVISLI